MRYLSLCSGIEAASVAWQPLGWEPVAFAEIEAFPSAVLKHHYPDVPNLGDITRFKGWPENLGTVDLVCGGTPCQSFSVAGLRAGLADPRGNLMLTFLAIAGRYRPRWILWENVPGVLSSGGGRDFGTFLSGLGQLGYGWAYRVLDAQFTRVDGFPRAVPQRRRRVFVVGCLGDWASAAAVLSERQSLLGDTPPRRKAGQGAAPTIASRATAGGGLGTDFDCDGGLIPSISNALAARDAKQPRAEDNVGLIAVPVHCVNMGSNKGLSGGISKNFAPPVDTNYAHVVAHALTAAGSDAGEDGTGCGVPLTVAHSLDAASSGQVTEDGTGRGVPLVAAALTHGVDSAGKGGYAGRRREDDENLVAFNARMDPVHGDVPGALDTNGSTQAVAIQSANRIEKGQGGTGVLQEGVMYTLTDADRHAVAFTASEQANGFAWESEVWQTLNAQVPSDTSNVQQGVRSGFAVRRLTPVECERLMGFPDGYTDVPYRGKPAADGPRYRALGNSWAVNCVRWIGRRIEMVEALAEEIRREGAA